VTELPVDTGFRDAPDDSLSSPQAQPSGVRQRFDGLLGLERLSSVFKENDLVAVAPQHHSLL